MKEFDYFLEKEKILNTLNEEDENQYNKELIERYPFCSDEDYAGTMLDEIPIGWRKRFGLYLLEDIKKEYDNFTAEEKEDFCILQTKEKYGELRVYYNGGNENIERIISDYSALSSITCVSCGKLFVPTINTGWVMPICKECAIENDVIDREYESYEPLFDCTATTYGVKRFSNDGCVETTYDFKYLVDKVS